MHLTAANDGHEGGEDMSGQPRIRHGHQGRWLQCQSKQDMAQRAARRSCYVRGVWPHRDATERA
eukprot:5217112-Ditylum_brightwellii.AAC.1